MLNNELTKFSKSPWIGATKDESWIVIVTKAYAMTSAREMPLDRLYDLIALHPKAASKRSFFKHHVNGVLARLGATVRLDLDIWQLITERAGMKPAPVRRRRASPQAAK